MLFLNWTRNGLKIIDQTEKINCHKKSFTSQKICKCILCKKREKQYSTVLKNVSTPVYKNLKTIQD